MELSEFMELIMTLFPNCARENFDQRFLGVMKLPLNKCNLEPYFEDFQLFQLAIHLIENQKYKDGWQLFG